VFMLAALNIEELKRLLDSLQTAKGGILDAYQTKTGMSREALGRMMARETWMTAQEAKEYGFIDEVITAKDKKKKKAGVNNSAAVINALVNYRNVPEGLMARYEEPTPDPSLKGGENAGEDKQAIEADPQVARLRAEAKLLKKE